MIPDASARFVALAALDGSSSDTRVAEAAAAVVERLVNAELHLIHVVPDVASTAFSPAPGSALIDGARAILEEAARCARAKTGKPVRVHITVGVAWKEVVRVGRQLGADLVLVGTHDRGHGGFTHFLLGSVAEHIVRHASCPAVLVRAKEPSNVPEIEPPCADCTRSQHETAGRTLFCARHREHHPHGHVYYDVPESFGVGSMLLRP
jgi:nucleotide-binding universal stress UspA family protein